MSALLGPDNAGDAIAATLQAAVSRLDVAVWEVGPSFAGALAAAATRARVHLLVDDHRGDGANPAAADRLRGGGVALRRIGRRGAEAHWKLIVAGPPGPGATLMVGSGNLIGRDAPRHPHGSVAPLAGTREWWISVQGAPQLAAAARRAIAAAWRLAHPPGPDGRWTVTPSDPRTAHPVGTPLPQPPPLLAEVAAAALTLATDAPACAALLGAQVAAARRRILVTVPYVHAGAAPVRPLLAGLAARAAEGIDVRLLLGSPPELDKSAATAAELAVAGIRTRVMDPARSTAGHAKGLVADAVVVAGSPNWSRSGLSTNREAALAVADDPVAGHYAAAFERDWEASA